MDRVAATSPRVLDGEVAVDPDRRPEGDAEPGDRPEDDDRLAQPDDRVVGHDPSGSDADERLVTESSLEQTRVVGDRAVEGHLGTRGRRAG